MTDKSPGISGKTGTLISIAAALVLMCVFRVDWWWWGKNQPVILGWLTRPMLYHLLIFAVGWLLVVLTVVYLWPDIKTPLWKKEERE
ncbi:MAG: hypothetical protein ACUVSK_11555 [Desulfotomaculales bacterium]